MTLSKKLTQILDSGAPFGNRAAGKELRQLLEGLAQAVFDVDFTVNAEDNNTITVNLQFKDSAGADLAFRARLPFYLSSDANGDALSAAPDTLAAGTDGNISEWTSDVSGMVTCESDGDADIVVGKSGAATYYLVVVLPGGSLLVSDAITFAA